MKALRLHIVLTLALLSIAARPSSPEQEVVGLWKKSNDWHHSICLRRADGTYHERGLLLFDPWKPPVPYESTGDWRLRGGRYFVTARSWSEPTLRGAVGKTYRHRVLRVEKQRFCYVSTNNTDEEE